MLVYISLAVDQNQKEEYKTLLNDKLSNFTHTGVYSCENLNCNKTECKEKIDKEAIDLLEIVTNCAWDTLEATAGTTGSQASKEKTIPGWNSIVN